MDGLVMKKKLMKTELGIVVEAWSCNKAWIEARKNISYKSNSFSSLAQWLLFMCQDPLYSQTVCPVFIEEFCELIQVLCRHKG